MKIYSLNPGLNLRNIIPEGIYNNSELFVQFLKAYYEWMHTTEFTVESISGTLIQGEAVQGQISKSTATISYVKSANSSYVVFITSNRPFEVPEILVGQTSGAQVRLVSLKDNVLRHTNQLSNYRDINQTVDKFEKYLKEELYAALPGDFDGDKREIAKKIRDFYLSKGQEQAYRYFMKTLYNEDIEITYPGDDILRVSAGNYLKETVIRANIIGDSGSPRIFDFLFKTIKGRTSGAIANVIDIKKKFVGSYYIAEFKVNFLSGTFTAGETIFDISDTSVSPLETTINGIISEYNIVDGGSGYNVGDALTVNGTGTGAFVSVSDISTARIDRLKVNTIGHGYRLGTTVTVDNFETGGSGLAALVTGITNTYSVTIGANTYTLGEISKISVSNSGSDYFGVPTLTLQDSLIANTGLLTDKYISIVNGGNTYSVGDTLNFLTANGAGAIAEVASVDLGVQSRTNVIRYSANTTGVVAGTPGTLPYSWYTQIYVTGANTLATSVVGSGVEDGLSYVDVRLSGTTGTSTRVQWYFDFSTVANAQHGETWSGSLHNKLVSGSFANTTSYGIRIDESRTDGVYITGGDNSAALFPTTSSLSSQRIRYTRTLNGGANTAKVFLSNIIYFANNSNVDFTIRLAAPQLERNHFVTDYIPTTNAAVTIAGYGEPTRINYIRNSRALNSANGTPGTPPTYWGVSPGSTLSSQIVGSGVEDGINYVDFRIFGTNSSGTTQFPNIQFENITQTPAVANSIWTASAYVRRVGGTTANVSGIIMVMAGYTANSVSTNQYAVNTISSLDSTSIATNRRLVTSSNTSFSNTETAFIRPWFQFQVANANTVDITVRLGAPQLEFGNTATSYIPTSNGAARRPSNEPTNDYFIYLENDDVLVDENREFLRYNTTDTANAEWMGVGRISRIRMSNFGSGYFANDLPLITVNTNTGSGANLIATNIQGRGASLQVDVANNSQRIGGIRRLEIIDFGVAYTSANVSTVGVGDGNANIIPIISGSGVTEGKFTDDAGKLDYKRIQDSYYYQEYSYVIRSGIEIEKYKNVLKKVLHPGGLEVFGEILIQNNLQLQSQIIQNLVIRLISQSDDVLTPEKVIDFYANGAFATYGDVPVSVLQNSLILPYRYYTFLNPYGESIYIQTERNIRLPGTVSVYSTNSAIWGTGTTFTSEFSSGDEIVVVNRNPSKNLLQSPDDLSAAIWTKVRLSSTNTVYNEIQGPFGTWTADRIVEDTTATNTHYLQQAVTIVAGQYYTASCYVKEYTGNRRFRLQFQTASGTSIGFRTIINLLTKTVTSSSSFGGGTSTGGSIVDVGNGWYRCSTSGKIDDANTAARLLVYMDDPLGNVTYTGNGVSGVYFDAFQVEQGNVATSYAGPNYNQNHKFVVNTVANNTFMTVRIPPIENVLNSEPYIPAI